MNVQLKSLTYSFRGQSRNVEFSDKTLISGCNGSGKSTTLNALLWLLSGYDLNDILNLNLFDNRTPNSPDNPKSVNVTATFDVDGKEIKLSKIAKQVWSRPRGGTIYKRGNDSYEYFINDLSVSATEYQDKIKELFVGGEKLKLMLNSEFWQLLDEKTLRKHFLSLCGTIDDTQFKNADYTPVKDLIHEVGVDKARQTFLNRIKDLKDAKKKQDVELEVQTQNLTDVSHVAEAEKKIEELKAERESIDAHLLGLGKVNEEYVAIRKAEEDKILEAENAYRRLKLKYEDEQRDKLREAQRKLDDALAHNRNLDSEEARLKRMIEDCESVIRTKELEIDEKLKEVERIDQRKFDGNCPHCGASLVGANRAEAIAMFKEKQSTDKSLTIEQGKRLRGQLNDAKASLPKWQEELSNLKRIDTKPLREELAKVEEANKQVFETTQEAKDMLAEIEMMKANRTEMQPNPDVEKGQIRKGEIDSELAELYKSLKAKDDRAKEESRIAQLQAMLSQTINALAENERMRDLVIEYQKEQSEIIRERTNKYFDKVSVKMEEENKSGELTPCCKLTIDDVADTANTASRTRIGFEVSRAFQRYYDRVLPLFLDRAESLNEGNIPVPDGQLVLLKVTEGDFKVSDYDKDSLKDTLDNELLMRRPG